MRQTRGERIHTVAAGGPQPYRGLVGGDRLANPQVRLHLDAIVPRDRQREYLARLLRLFS